MTTLGQTEARMANDGHDAILACLNCGAVPAGAWCQSCGQRAGPAHRSLLHLGAELAEILTHADSRLRRTLRRLLIEPDGLTRDFLAGKRASQTPPLRLFFVIMVVAFAVGALGGHQASIEPLNPSVQTQLHAAIAKLSTGQPVMDAWLRLHLDRAVRHPDQVLRVMREWSERFAILMLPIAGLMLWVLHLPPGRATLYDTLVLSIHALSFVGLVLIAFFVLCAVLPNQAGFVLLVLPVHLFVHLRGVFRSGVVATLARMLVLAAGTAVALALLSLGLAAVGLEFGAVD